MSFSPARIRRRLEKAVLQHGPLKTAGLCLVWPLMWVGWRIIERTPFERRRVRAGEAFDRLHGVDTTRDRSTEWSTDVESESWAEGTGFYPTPPDAVRRSIRALPVDPGNFVFIDLGSGKGRVVLVASEFPFRACLGVEYAPDLHEVAERNIAAFRSDRRRCETIRSHCHDATTFPLPEAPLVFFFAHPFGGAVLDRFLEHVRASVRRAPRPVYVIEYDPVYRDRFPEAGFREVFARDMDDGDFLPDVFYRLEFFSRHTFRNRKGKEFVIYELDRDAL